MQGRYGFDQLSMFILVIHTTIAVVELFIGSIVLSAVVVLLTIYLFYRAFSRNYARRRAENEAFMKIFRVVKRPFSNLFMRLRDINKYRYRKCRRCGKMLRLPIKKGKHSAACPCCKEKRKVWIII